MTSRCHLRRALFAVALSLAPVAALAEFSAEKLALIDRPFIGDQIALSPDGRYLAYTQHDADRHTLFIADLDKHSKKAIPLTIGQRTDRVFRELTVLRWATADRLILQEADGQIIAVDADGGNSVRLWSNKDDGLVNDGNMRYFGFFVTAEPPRVLPPIPDDPEHILIESSARLGPERLANLHRADIRTGKIELANPRLYEDYQVALYGPGDLLIFRPAKPQEDSNRRVSESGGPAVPNSREADQKIYQYNAPISSSTGQMLYDRQGRPRILYEQPPQVTRRRFSYTEAGKPPLEVGVMPIALEELLGLRTFREEVLGKVGEFEIRPETWFGERSYPLAFDYDPEVVYLASNVGRDTWGIYSLNLKTKARVELAPGVTGIDMASGDPEEPPDMLVFDDAQKKLVGIRLTTIRPRTYWLDSELRELQEASDRLLPKYTVEILSWDTKRTRFVLRASSEGDPGAIFIYHRTEDRLEQFTTRAPWLAQTELKPSVPFDFETPAGVHLTGYLTLPTHAIVDPPPLLIYGPAGLWERMEPGFNREAEMLADMGIVVMRLNYRGSAGFGRKHLTAIQQGIDTIPVEDLVAAVDWIASRRPIDRKRVVAMGEGFGGYLALRAVQNHPDIFRAAISVNAPTNLKAWGTWRALTGFNAMKPTMDPGYESAGMKNYYDFQSLVREDFVKNAKRGAEDISEAVAEGKFRKPVLLISNPQSGDLTPLSSLFGMFGLGLEGMTVQRMSMNGDFVGGTFDNRTRVFRKIEEFLNYNLYVYDTEIGDLKEVPMPATKK